MNEAQLLKSMKKKKYKSSTSIGLALGEDTYNKLDAYCTKNNIYKCTLVKAIVVEYLDNNTNKESECN